MTDSSPSHEAFHDWARAMDIPPATVTASEDIIRDHVKPVTRRNEALGIAMEEELFERAREALTCVDVLHVVRETCRELQAGYFVTLNQTTERPEEGLPVPRREPIRNGKRRSAEYR